MLIGGANNNSLLSGMKGRTYFSGVSILKANLIWRVLEMNGKKVAASSQENLTAANHYARLFVLSPWWDKDRSFFPPGGIW